MYDDQLTTNELFNAIDPLMAETIHKIDITNIVYRKYSCIRFLEIETERATSLFVAKTIKQKVVYEKEVRLRERALATFRGYDNVCIPYIGAHDPNRLMLMPMVDDPPMGSLCKLSKYDFVPARRISHKRRKLEIACYDAGKWLRAWHESTLGYGSLNHAFDVYFSDRQHHMECLDAQTGKCLRSLIEGVSYGDTCAPHGDFSALNMLWTPRVLTVMDFGIEEWERMSPWWDCVCFEIGLLKTLRFSLKGVGTWFPSVYRNSVESFRSGYGRRGFDRRIEIACRAVRHWTLYVSDLNRRSKYKRRASWHLRRLQHALSEAKNEGFIRND